VGSVILRCWPRWAREDASGLKQSIVGNRWLAGRSSFIVLCWNKLLDCMATSLNLCSSGKTQSPVCDIPGRPFQGVKAFAILLLDRWNDHFPIRWQPKIRFSMMHHGRPINVAASMANREYCCFRELFLQGVCDHPLGNPETILGANCGFATLLFAARYPKARIAAVEPHPSNLAAPRENLNLHNVRA
jgi:hypothetical protein